MAFHVEGQRKRKNGIKKTRSNLGPRASAIFDGIALLQLELLAYADAVLVSRVGRQSGDNATTSWCINPAHFAHPASTGLLEINLFMVGLRRF